MADGFLTTHVLDTARGIPGAGISLALRRAGEAQVLASARTNADGRTDQPLLAQEAFATGCYELCFEVGEYFARLGYDLPDPPFLDRVVLSFGIADIDSHYHVPLLVSPWSYSTYRGS